jgi:hypothetical protein
MTKTVVAALAVAVVGCIPPTQFKGEAKVENGPRGCWEQCQAWGMDLAGMVKMGEYSDGCICQVRPPPPQPSPYPPPPQQPQAAPRSDAPAKLDGPAVAGVWMQMEAAAAAQAAQQRAWEEQRRRWDGSSGGSSRPYGPGHPLWH